MEYSELGECLRAGAQPKVSGEEARADMALMIAATADLYQGEIDEHLGLV